MFVVLVLVSALSTTGRPRECGDAGGHAANVWERAKSPELRRYCDLVASASSKLAGTRPMADAALLAAREADRVSPGHAASRVVEGRALAALGRFDEALTAMREARARDPRALDEPFTLLAWARALARGGHGAEAAEAYRALLPRVVELSVSERSSAQIEAGLVAMGRGVPGLDEAAAALRDALRTGDDESLEVAVLGLALVLDRRGDSEQARALLRERARRDPRNVLASSRAKEVLAVAPNEVHAMAALALELTDSAGARDEWQRAIGAAPAGPWAAHARAHLEAAAKVGSRSSQGGAR